MQFTQWAFHALASAHGIAGVLAYAAGLYAQMLAVAQGRLGESTAVVAMHQRGGAMFKSVAVYALVRAVLSELRALGVLDSYVGHLVWRYGSYPFSVLVLVFIVRFLIAYFRVPRAQRRVF